jgi:L-amino acid N-acyltransferase YncA
MPDISAAIREAVAKRYSVTLLYVHDLDGIPEVAADPACRIELLGEERAHLLTEVDHIDLEQVRARFRRGDLCYLGLLDGRPAHFNWAQASGSHPASGTGRSFSVKDGEVWLYSGHTAEWARGRRLQPAALTRMLSDARQNGFLRAWTYIRESNSASRKSAERVGFRVARRLRSVWISRYCLPLP